MLCTVHVGVNGASGFDFELIIFYTAFYEFVFENVFKSFDQIFQSLSGIIVLVDSPRYTNFQLMIEF